jgi:hypothetical protein
MSTGEFHGKFDDGIRSWKWIAWTLALSFACSVTSAAWAQTKKAHPAAARDSRLSLG